MVKEVAFTAMINCQRESSRKQMNGRMKKGFQLCIYSRFDVACDSTSHPENFCIDGIIENSM
jgi:hypothetical protein